MSIEEAADRIASSEFVRVVAHADADGVSSAACLCSALSSLGIGYHFTALEDPSDVSGSKADVFCDIGAGYLDSLGDAVVIDHHPPRGIDGFDGVLVGTDAPSSSVVAYRVAREIGVGASESVSALIGAVGDGVSLDNEDVADVVEDALEAGAKKEGGARLVGEDAVEGLAYSTRPFTRLSGDYEGARAFIEDVEDELPTALVLLALTEEGPRPEAVEELIGDIYRLPFGVDIHTLSRYVEACAVSGKHGLALSVCLDPTSHTEEARESWRAFESTVTEKVRGADIEGGKDGKPAFARTEGSFDTGAVADVLYDWVTGDVVVVNESGDASFRAESFDCGRIAHEAASSVDGEGGGHPSRAGVSFDVPREDFLEAVRRTI